MEVLTYAEARKTLGAVMDRVVADHSLAIIARDQGEAVVIVSLADWTAMNKAPVAPA